MEFVGIIETSKENFEKNKDNIKVLGNIEELGKLNTKYKFDTLVLADSNLSESKTSSIFDFCDEKKVNFKEIPNLFKVKTSNTIYSTIGGIPVINFRRTPLEGWGSIVKRIFDIFISFILIIIFSPIMLLTALAIKIGRDGKEFTYFKFRSMVQNAHELRYDPSFRKKVEDTRGWNSDNPMIKYKNDPRITKVGHIIRKYSIDELAEFFLVFIGSMSMVGPRPHEKEEVEKYKKFHKKVLSIKPGITGMGQTSGRSDLTFSDEVGLDIYYIENWSLWLDIKILFKTPIAIFQKRKAL
jgi:lipopolysaccharide/colanic/teichoic acid biosynthesis glycosyltransferase